MSHPIVAGVGMHEFGRFPDASLKDLARIAIVRALADAGLGVKDVEAVYSANALAGVLQGQEQIRGQTVLRDVGIERVPVVNVENACASAATAFAQAATDIRAGAHRVVLAVGFEKMFVGDTGRSLDALESAADVEVVAGLGLQFTAIYAMRVRRRIDAGELTRRHLVDVAVKSHRNGALNPYAQHRTPLSAEEVAGSAPIAEPLTLFMCSSICDGAAAAVLVAGDHAAAERHPRVAVRASALASGYAHTQPEDPSIVTLCAEGAYEQAAIGPADVDVAEVHDAMAPGELLYYEQLGFCGPGEAGEMLDSGATELTGRLPVNSSGGLCSRGHPVGATGLAQIAELTWQLRGEAGERQVDRPRMALAQNSGGWLEGGEPRMERTFDVDQTLMRVGTGLPVATPTVDLIEIGAGGGSIAKVNLGIIEVGPESAGADPGPVCYATGGTRPTVTDANAVLGYLDPEYFLGGVMGLDVEGARAAIDEQIAAPLGLDTAAAAWGIHEAITSNMEHAIRSVTIERGHDPRDLTLVAFGGAGPSHAARLARDLGIPEVLFPAAAGIASAVGLLEAAPRVDLARTLVARLDDAGIDRLKAELTALDEAVRARLAGVSRTDDPQLTRRVDMQYAGQGHVIEVELPDPHTPDFAAELRRRFEGRYAELYGYRYDGATPQIVAVTVAGALARTPFELPANRAAEPPPPATRRVYFPETGGHADCAVHRREHLPAGFELDGPAVIEDPQCAILILPGDHATVDEHSHVLARIDVGPAATPAAQKAELWTR